VTESRLEGGIWGGMNKLVLTLAALSTTLPYLLIWAGDSRAG
jgi:hypothetical protein